MRARINNRLRPGHRRLRHRAASTAAHRLLSLFSVVLLFGLGIVSVGVVGLLSGPAVATTAVSAWTAKDAPLPANAAADPLAVLGAVACSSDGSCVATGDYTDTSGNQQGLIETLADGTWSAQEAPVPADAGGNPLVLLGAVACPADGSCVATGSYGDASGDQQGLIETLSSSVWTGIVAPLPGNADGNPRSSIGAPACPSEDSCVATGDYIDTGGNTQSAIETLADGTWTSVQAPLPLNVGPKPSSSIGVPACPALGSCVAMVGYTDTSGNVESGIDTLSGNTWTSLEAPLPADEAASGHQRNLLSTVTCPAPGSCVSVGVFSPTSGNFEGWIETLSEGTWTPTEAPLPSDAPATNAFSDLDVAMCDSVGDCAALGWYFDTAGRYHVVMEVLTSGTWTAVEQPLPAHPAAKNPPSPGRGIGGVFCPSTGSCVAVGSYFDASRKDKSIIETLAAGTWSSIKAPLPAAADGPLDSSLADLTCTPDGSCIAVGTLGGDPLIETMPGGESAPTVTSPNQTTFTLGQVGSFPVTAAGSPAPSITKRGKLPRGLHFTTGTGTATFSGTPTGGPGTFHITLEAQNGVLPAAFQFFTLTIAAAP